MELPYFSSIEIQAIVALDTKNVNGTLIPDEDVTSGNQKRGRERYNGDLYQESVIGDQG